MFGLQKWWQTLPRIERIQIALTMVSASLITITSIQNSQDIVVLSFIGWSIITFSVALVSNMNNINAGLYWLFAVSDMLTGVIAFYLGVKLGLSPTNAIVFIGGVLSLSLVLIFGRKHKNMCMWLNVILTAIPHIPLIMYYYGENKAGSIYITAIFFALIALFIQLFFSEDFLKKLKIDWKNSIWQSSITLEWIIFTIVEFPMVVYGKKHLLREVLTFLKSKIVKIYFFI